MSPCFLYSNMQIKAHANEVVTDWVGNLPCDQKIKFRLEIGPK